MRAVIYVRVSSKEQLDNLSLPVQERECRAFCAREGLEVARVFVERGESAKTSERTEFRAFLQYAAANRGKIHAVVVYSLTRFSRNQADHHTIRAFLRGLGVLLRSVTEPIGESPEGRFMEGILASVAQFENEAKAHRTVLGMKEAARRGRWIWMPPLGYLRRQEKDGPNITPDPERAALVARAFDLCDQGHSQADITQILRAAGLRTARGLTLSPQQVAKMLRNPAYKGVIRVAAWGQQEHAGTFEPLIDADLFARVQRRLAKPPARAAAPRVRMHADFPLRAFVRCACGRPMTGSWAKGHLGVRYAYYHCPKACGARTIRKGDLEDAFLELAGRLVPDGGYLKLVRLIVLDAWRAERAMLTERRAVASRALEHVRLKLSQLEDAYIYRQALDDETYRQKREALRLDVAAAQIEFHEADIDETDVEGILASAEEIIGNAGMLWRLTEDVEQRSRLQWLLFPEGLKWSGAVATGFSNPVSCLSYYNLAGLSAENSRLG